MDEVIVDKIINSANFNSKIGILGLSFKSNTDDTRNSTSYKIIELLIKKGYKNILAYDPVAISNFKDMYNLDI